MYDFGFERPRTVTAAIDALKHEDAQALGGGQTLIPTLKQRLAMPSKLVSLGGSKKCVLSVPLMERYTSAVQRRTLR